MRKIPTLFVRDPDDRSRLTRDVHPGCGWVAAGEGRATRKYDGTCLLLDDEGQWWARREVKAGKMPPKGWALIDRDDATGKSVGWEPIGQSPFVKAWEEALRIQGESGDLPDPGTHELCGPKVNGNPERFDHHVLLRHGACEVPAPRTFDALAAWLHAHPHEGVVWHHPDGRMAKIKRRDFRSSEAFR